MDDLGFHLKCLCGKDTDFKVEDVDSNTVECPHCGRGYFFYLSKFEPDNLVKTDEPECTITIEPTPAP